MAKKYHLMYNFGVACHSWAQECELSKEWPQKPQSEQKNNLMKNKCSEVLKHFALFPLYLVCVTNIRLTTSIGHVSMIFGIGWTSLCWNVQRTSEIRRLIHTKRFYWFGKQRNVFLRWQTNSKNGRIFN